MKLPDECWRVIKRYLLEMCGQEADEWTRQQIEMGAEIVPFDGGVFIVDGNEFDLFVETKRRGKWRIRSTIGKFLDDMLSRYDRVVVRIKETNYPSLRLAYFFGFREFGRDEDFICLEKVRWAR